MNNASQCSHDVSIDRLSQHLGYTLPNLITSELRGDEQITLARLREILPNMLNTAVQIFRERSGHSYVATEDKHDLESHPEFGLAISPSSGSDSGYKGLDMSPNDFPVEKTPQDDSNSLVYHLPKSVEIEASSFEWATDCLPPDFFDFSAFTFSGLGTQS
jgi:hypothetical protein